MPLIALLLLEVEYRTTTFETSLFSIVDLIIFKGDVTAETFTFLEILNANYGTPRTL